MVESVETRAGSVGSAVEARVGELLNDYLDRRARGEQISEEVLLAEHPDVAEVLAQHLSMLRALAPSANAIQELISKRVLSPSSSPEYAAELGNYRITGVIGRGGMGIVLRAIEQPLNRPVALKILRPELAVDRRALIRFEHEAKAAAALRHPNIVTVYACGEHDGTNYLAMELVEGPSLADLLAQQTSLPTEEIWRIFRELLEGLAAAHGAGLIHRDIKSSNILLDGPKRRVKIADFGLARITASSTRVTMPQSAIGTPEYMSPEQARGDEDIDHRTDLYSAGVVLYEMLTGRVPFKGDSPSALIHAILNTEPPAPRALRTSADQHLSRLALRLMAKERGDRFAATVDALTALEQGRGVRLRWSNRFRRRMLGAACLVASVTCLLWAASLFLSPLRLTEVRVGKDSGTATPRIEARWGSNLEFEEFYTFPPAAGFVAAVEKVDPGPGYEAVVLASTHAPVDGKSLFAFHPGRASDDGHEPFWSESLFRPYEWPDTTVTDFRAAPIIVGNYDGQPGDEVVLVVSEGAEYPTYVALFDPRKLTITARYWHIGKISVIEVAPDFLGPGRPAIIALGINNKLDGFNEPREEDPQPLANSDLVSVLMILDMSEMQDERLIDIPHAPKRMPNLQLALPYAYAFLNAAPHNPTVYIDPKNGEHRKPNEAPEAGEIMIFEALSVIPCPGHPESRSCIQVSIHRASPQADQPFAGGVLLRLDSNLEVVFHSILGAERVFLTIDPWLERFKRLVVQGKYVGPSQ